MNKTLFFVIMTCVLFPMNALAQENQECSSTVKEVPFQSKKATAAMFDNLRNKPGSLRYETSALFEQAMKKLEQGSLDSPEAACPANCRLSKEPDFVFRSVPMKFLSAYSEHSKCQALLEQTKQKPFIYKDRIFDSLALFNDWYNEFSQGKGEDGKDLYNRCDGSCSPQYLSRITRKGGKLHVTSEVICGHARDKKDNMYQVSSSFRWICRPTENPS